MRMCIALLFAFMGQGLVAVPPQSPKGREISKLVKNSLPSVFQLVTFDSLGKEIATATGFVVSSDGKIVTNHHVLEGATRIEARAGNGGKFSITGILADDPKNDLVILKMDGSDFKPLQISIVNEEVGSRVVVIGSPMGLGGTVSEGIVSAHRSIMGKSAKVLQITAAISPGSSGSPVLNHFGKVTGVASASLESGQALNFAVGVEVLSEVILRAEKADKLTSFDSQLGERIPVDAILADPDYQVRSDLSREGKFSELLKNGQNLVKRYPKDYRAFYTLGMAYVSLRIRADAITALQESTKLKSDYGRCWTVLGTLYQQENRDRDAQFAYEQGVKYDPTYARGEALSLLGSMYFDNNRQDEGIELLERCLALRDGKEVKSDKFFYQDLGNKYAKRRQFSKAEEIVQKLRKFDVEASKVLEGAIRIVRDGHF